ncbi:oocyte zinc finger protein XlCOF6-like [Dysidea avara]|uniref:oocyte zinc finger protein XlCOF6-like n=1 Tax=Dysidea avara TaxID=196820 RepID=UPI00332DF91C
MELDTVHGENRLHEREVADIDECSPVNKKQKRIDNDMEKTPEGVKKKDFSVRLTPLQDIPTTHHSESTGDDNVIFCINCGKPYHGDCPVHGPLIPLDESRGWDQDSKSFTSVPVPLQVTVKMSSIMNVGKGVFAKEFIPRRTRIGPYKGEVVQKEDVTDETDTSYFWEIRKNGSESYYIDAKNEKHANWLRFINYARSVEEQNLLSFQYQGNIYCHAIDDIKPGTELLVWYGEQYVKLLGLPVDQIIDANYTCSHCKVKFVDKSKFDLHLKYSQACCDANPQVFKCGKCREVFTTLINLQQHIRRHDQNNHPTSSSSRSREVIYSLKSLPAGDSEHFQCEFCGECFTQNEDLQSHVEIHYESQDEYFNEESVEQSSLESDVEAPTEERPHQCQYCSKSFKTKFNMKRHLLIHTGEKPHQCQHCTKSFADSSTLRQHLSTHSEEKPYQCHHCSKQFADSRYLQRHLWVHTREKSRQCQHCSESFADSDSLQHHLRTHTEDSPHQCHLCSKSFSYSSSLYRHLKTHKEGKSYKCHDCNKSFYEESKLKRHMLVHTGHQCQHCTKSFRDNFSLQRHLPTHTREHQCTQCSEVFTRPYDLHCHLQTHSGGKLYQCSHCNKKFASNSKLNKHLRTHTGEKRFHCEHCSKSFLESFNLQRHLRIHTGEKPYKCEHCNKTFTDSTTLRRHLMTHSGEKPHQCQHCSKGFIRATHLQTHLKTHAK